MAADSIAVAIEKGHFDGGANLSNDRRRPGTVGSKELAQILRNFADQSTERVQSGQARIAAGTATATITLAPAMPDSSYDVSVTLRSTPIAAALNGADLKALIVLDGEKSSTLFKVTAIPAGLAALDIDFYWIARSRTQLNSAKR